MDRFLRRYNGANDNNNNNHSKENRVVRVESVESLVHSNQDQLLQLLPDELILNIFSWLYPYQVCECSKVCRRWYRLYRDEQLVRITR